ncbi:conserved hypothetical protein [Ricinus communis]|uniref:CCHC-type domain-containing protein n=1 Tax=Ricinus communis TaxID=3988 RepID=B9SSG8_RICCO|nr:conserved hypothetical protein [Ricinus communis]
MGTRTNFYKNPSISYKKDFSISSVLQNLKAYNIATGNAPVTDEEEQQNREIEHDRPKKVGQKRRSTGGSPRRTDIEEHGGPMSHQDYLQGSCSSVLNLVDYGTWNAKLNFCKVLDLLSQSTKIQTFPSLASNVPYQCLTSGTLGTIIATAGPERDLIFVLMNAATEQNQMGFAIILKEREEEERVVGCWKCQRPGHLAEDCLVTVCSQVAEGHKKNSIPKDLLGLYRRCHQMGKNLAAANCNSCCSSSSLATCLHCSAVLCDW